MSIFGDLASYNTRVYALDKAIAANPDAPTEDIVADAVTFEGYLLGARDLDADEREFTIQIASDAVRLLEKARPLIESGDTGDDRRARIWRFDRDQVVGQLNELITNLRRGEGAP